VSCTIDAMGKVFQYEGGTGVFEAGTYRLGQWLVSDGDKVDTGHWQALTDVPQTQTRELRSVVLMYGIPESVEQLDVEVTPSKPWAELQFQERVAGEPLNPGETYLEWPWYKGNVPDHQDEETKFSHTYMERYWPRQAGGPASWDESSLIQNRGIRYRYGDLQDVVNLLAKQPYTRQAYLPVWFPEDTGATSDQRVPCSLGYHFMLRGGKLHCLYTIRSCDFLRHFRDDVYLTARLVQWVLERLVQHREFADDDENLWDDVTPGELTMVMHSLHVFEGDMTKMRKEYGFVASSSTD
jgi:Thymidylate synthase